MVCYYLYNANFRTMAYVVAVFDLLPGAVIFLHYYNSTEWKESTHLLRAVFCVLMLFQPFSILVTHAMWLCKIRSPKFHHLAKLSKNVHGSFEAPSQLLMTIFMIGKSQLQLPWLENVVITDRNGNEIRLGKIGALSLVLSASSLLSATLDASELNAWQEKLRFMVLNIICILFRLPALALIILYTEEKSLVLFIILILANLVLFMSIRERDQKDWFSAPSSVLFSLYLPVSAAKYPFKCQLAESSDVLAQETEKERLATFKRKVSARTSLLTNPIIYIGNYATLLLIEYAGMSYDPNIIISETQHWEIFYYYITPMFLLSIAISLVFHPSTHTSNLWKYCKIAFRFAIVFGAIAVVVGSQFLIEKRTTMLLGYFDDTNKMNIFTGTSSGLIDGCLRYKDFDYRECRNLSFAVGNVAKIKTLNPSEMYIESSLPLKEYNFTSSNVVDTFYDLRMLNSWGKKMETSPLSRPRCVECVEKSNICLSFLARVGNLQDCNSGCEDDRNCVLDRQCRRTEDKGFTCKDPCQEKPCEENERCVVKRHQVTCDECKRGYGRNKEGKCSKLECQSAEDCPDKNTLCQFGQCIDPCYTVIDNQYRSTCAENANCKVKIISQKNGQKEIRVKECYCPNHFDQSRRSDPNAGGSCQLYECNESCTCLGDLCPKDLPDLVCQNGACIGKR